MTILKRIGSVMLSAALMCSVVALPVAAKSTEPTIIYNRDFDTDDSVSYVHHTEIPDEMTADVFSITEDANKSIKGDSSSGEEGTFRGYFSTPYTEDTNGILHISYDTTMNKVIANNINYNLIVKTNSIPDKHQNMWLGVRYKNEFGYRTWWQGSERMTLNAGSLDWDSTTESETITNVGDISTKKNTIEYYVDLKAYTVAIVVNGVVGPVMSLRDISTDPQKDETGAPSLPRVTEDVKSIEGIVLPLAYKSVTKADASTVIIGEEVLYDNIKAEILPVSGMGEVPELALVTPLTYGGMKNISADTYSGAVETSIKDENNNAVKGIKLPLNYDFGETITAENNNVLHTKFDVLATETSTDYVQFNLMPGTGSTKHWFLSVDDIAIRNGGSIWTNWNGSAVNSFYDEATGTDYRIGIEAYLDLKLGKAAIKYGEHTGWVIREIPTALRESGIKAFNIHYENRLDADGKETTPADEIFVDNLTIEKLNGGLLSQDVDFGYVGIPYSNSYVNESNGVTQVEAGKPLNYNFLEPIKDGKVYISFDFKSQEQDGLIDYKSIYLKDGNGDTQRRIGMFHEKISLVAPGAWNNDGDEEHKYSVSKENCNKWYHIDIVLDYESATLDDEGNDLGANAHFYCNGQSIGTQILPVNGVSGIKMDLFDEREGTKEPYFIDNVKIDRIVGIADVTDAYGTELTADSNVEAGKYTARALLEETDENANNKRLILVWYDGKVLIDCKMVNFSKLTTADDNKSAVAEAIAEMEITSDMAAAGNTMKAYIWDMGSGALRPIGNEKIK